MDDSWFSEQFDGQQFVLVSWDAVSYTHLRAHETVLDLVCRLLLEKKKNNKSNLIHVHSKQRNYMSTNITN